MKTGLTERTPVSMQLGAGVFLKSYTKGGTISSANIIGATRGGGTFTATPNIRQVAVDGAPTYTKELEVIDDWTVTLAVANFIEFNDDTIGKTLGGGFSANTDPTSGDTTMKVTRTIAQSDYNDIYWVGDASDGTNLVIHLKDAISLGGLTITTNDKGEGTFPATFTAHYAYSSSNANWAEEAPFEIIKEAAA